jgi:HK97 family phage prohead protease
MPLTYKTIPFKIEELKADGSNWEFSGHASVFGNVDHGGDVVMPGAFAGTLARRSRRPLLWQHNPDEPIGVEVELREDEVGLFGKWRLVDTARGTDCHKLLKAGAIDAMSIGYFPEEVAFDGDIRKIVRLELLENSVVTLGMNELARVETVKSRPFDVHSGDVRVAVEDWMERIRSGSDLRQKDGREPITEARRAVMAELSGSLRKAVDELDALLQPPAPPERIHIGLELTRRRLERHGALERSA